MALGFLKKAVKTLGKVPGVKTAVNVAASPVTLAVDIGKGKNVGKSVLKTVKQPIKGVARDAKSVVNIAKKVPVVGKGVGGVLTVATAPVMLASAVASGERIDNAILNNLKSQAKAVKDVAPYVKTVVSLVPGVGTGAAAAIAAGAALAEGQPISSAITAGIQGAIPGGTLATSTYNAATAAIAGNPTASAQLGALKLTPQQKKDLNIVVNTAKSLSNGVKINTAASVKAKAALPKEIRSALDIGIAVGHAQKIQVKTKKSVTPTTLNSLAKKGAAIAATNAVAKAAVTRIKNPRTAAGYKVGAAVASQPATALKLAAISANLKPDEQRGFEMAIAEKIGSIEEEVPEEIQGNPDAEFAFAVTMGAQTMSEPARENLIEAMAQDPKLVPGIEAATKSLSITGRFKAFIKRVINAIKGK